LTGLLGQFDPLSGGTGASSIVENNCDLPTTLFRLFCIAIYCHVRFALGGHGYFNLLGSGDEQDKK
jgi:hypothetical protein